MTYSIIGFGKVGQALARAFARKGLAVTVASHRPPEALAPLAQALGPTVNVTSLEQALQAETIFLAVPFDEHRSVGAVLPDWTGKTIIDAMNSLALRAALDGLVSTAFVARSFPGAKLVKGFNHLVAGTLATDPVVGALHRVVFLSSDAPEAIPPVADLARSLGFAPVELGRLAEGGALVHAQDGEWGKLIFKDVFKAQ